MNKIKLAIDLDNTIINYDHLFYKAARNKLSIQSNIKNKENIKKLIIKKYSEKKWTEIQSAVYSQKIFQAKIFPGFINEIKKLSKYCEIFIVSHKTLWPIYGKKINLHNKTKQFLKKKKISFCKNYLIKEENIFFETTKEKKIKRIERIKPDYFIDDLESILKNIPKSINKILFNNKKNNHFENLTTWFQLNKFINKYQLYLNSIKKKYGNNVKIIKEIKRGTNNYSLIIKISNKLFYLKIFPNEANSLKKNIKEFNFLSSLKKAKIFQIADPIYINLELNYSLYSFIKGTVNSKPSNEDINQCIEFIRKIQKAKKYFFKYSNRERLYATDYLRSIFSYSSNIDQRILKLKSKLNNQKIINFLSNKVLPKWNLFKKTYKNDIKNLKIDKKEFILSPSDFTFKNTLKVKSKIFFCDFEYSGLDHPYKLVSDFICQPDINISSKKKLYVLSNFQNFIKFDHTIFNLILNITKFKWCLIILKALTKNNKTSNPKEDLFLKSQIYFKNL
ncbi:hypothetical protein MCEMIE29_00197 [Candidatus Pelagibacterales bacterium]